MVLSPMESKYPNLNLKLWLFQVTMILNCDFNHEPPWILILYHVYKKLMLVLNPMRLNNVLYWFKCWISDINVKIRYYSMFLYYSRAYLKLCITSVWWNVYKSGFWINAFMLCPQSFVLFSITAIESWGLWISKNLVVYLVSVSSE